MDLWREVGAQLRNPTGLAGRVMGDVMRLINRRPNALSIEALEIGQSDTILELGFGPGHAIRTMSAIAPLGKIYGVDRSPIMIEQAQARNLHAIRFGQVVLLQSSFDEIPLADEFVDKILAVNVVYFWKDADAILREIRRVLRPGGRLVIYATHAATMQHWKFAGPETHRVFTAETLGALLGCSDFGQDATSVKSIHVGPGVTGLIATALRRRADDGNLVACDSHDAHSFGEHQ